MGVPALVVVSAAPVVSPPLVLDEMLEVVEDVPLADIVDVPLGAVVGADDEPDAEVVPPGAEVVTDEEAVEPGSGTLVVTAAGEGGAGCF